MLRSGMDRLDRRTQIRCVRPIVEYFTDTHPLSGQAKVKQQSQGLLLCTVVLTSADQDEFPAVSIIGKVVPYLRLSGWEL